MNRSQRDRSMPLLFELRDGGKSRFVLYEKVLSDRACGRRVVAQAWQELDAWRRGFGRLFAVLRFAGWSELMELLERLRGPSPARSPAHTRAKSDSQYAQEKFYEAIALLDRWRRTYEELFAQLKHADGTEITQAIEQAFHPRGGKAVYVWQVDRSDRGAQRKKND